MLDRLFDRCALRHTFLLVLLMIFLQDALDTLGWI